MVLPEKEFPDILMGGWGSVVWIIDDVKLSGVLS